MKLSSLPDTGDRQAWLVMTKSAYRRLGGSKYDDNPASHYSWDSTVPNHLDVRAGDIILLWNERESLGVSVIEKIDEGTDTSVAGAASARTAGAPVRAEEDAPSDLPLL
ncbi:hypothetical protein R1X32_49200 [Rhodococcus opacus]|uniref:hypothetical protein n=1 Tax=Rhodococcus opacus TaxID=37919 RepID=UPI0034D1DB95